MSILKINVYTHLYGLTPNIEFVVVYGSFASKQKTNVNKHIVRVDFAASTLTIIRKNSEKL
jgi:hypothetical protein